VLNAMGIQMTLVPKMKFRKRTKQKELLRRREKGAVQGVGYSMYKKIR
jgi:hypothetical protein